MSSNARAKVRALQTIIASRIPIAIDGRLGPESYAALVRLDLEEREALETVSGMMEIPLSADFISTEEVILLARQISGTTGVPVSYLIQCVTMENVPVTGKGFLVEYDGTFRGLGQFNETTWKAVMPDHEFSRVTDHKTSLLAIARLYNRNKQSFVSQGFNMNGYSDDIAYLYHNQGASSAKKFLKSGKLSYPGQSLSALNLFAKVRSDNEYTA